MVGDGGRLVDGPADAVAAQFREDRETSSADRGLYYPADLVDGTTGPDHRSGSPERELGALSQLVIRRRHRRQGHADRRVSDVAVQLRRHVYLDQIPWFYDPVSRDAV